MSMISDNLSAVRQRMAAACAASGRAPQSVRLLAVSKTWGADAVRAAYAAGQTAFGENYIQEGTGKIAHLADLPLEWHMIGPIQSNKTRLVAENFAWVHSIDRLKIAQRLAEQRPAHLPPVQLCLQVNLDGGANKSGVPPQELRALALAVAQLPRVSLRGLMVIPEPAIDFVVQKRLFTWTFELFEQLKPHLPVATAWDTLSMGMSGDMDSAISAGSTMVRVGTAVFGGRAAKAQPSPGPG